MEIPESLKNNREVAPFLARARELIVAQPVVSYYCKVYVLEHILSNQLHVGNSEVETFTIGLLDETEAIKNGHEDENVRHVLQNRQLSVNVVFAFAFRLFHSCLEEIAHYDAARKIALATKLRAAINFFNVLRIFTGDEETIDFDQTTGGKCTSKDEFVAFVKEKSKTLKYQLSRLIKNEIPVAGEEEELNRLVAGTETPDVDPETEATEPKPELEVGPELGLEVAPESEPDSEPVSELQKGPLSTGFSTSPSPTPDTFGAADDSLLSLPGVPRFDPSQEDDEIKLPGAPLFLPDDDVSHINKKSSIHMIPPQDQPKELKPAPKPEPKPAPKESKLVQKLTKADITSIIDSTEHISQIQKHAKFAISALNYEDLDTAEKELRRGLELLALVRQRE